MNEHWLAFLRTGNIEEYLAYRHTSYKKIH